MTQKISNFEYITKTGFEAGKGHWISINGTSYASFHYTSNLVKSLIEATSKINGVLGVEDLEIKFKGKTREG